MQFRDMYSLQLQLFLFWSVVWGHLVTAKRMIDRYHIIDRVAHGVRMEEREMQAHAPTTSIARTLSIHVRGRPAFFSFCFLYFLLKSLFARTRGFDFGIFDSQL